MGFSMCPKSSVCTLKVPWRKQIIALVHIVHNGDTQCKGAQPQQSHQLLTGSITQGKHMFKPCNADQEPSASHACCSRGAMMVAVPGVEDR